METVIKLTKEKFDEMNQKLDYLRTVRRSEISDAIKHAKEFGDLSENAEYSAAKDAQVANEAEIARIEDTLALVEIIDDPSLPVVCNINVGHAMPRCIIPFGIDAHIDVRRQSITFEEE